MKLMGYSINNTHFALSRGLIIEQQAIEVEVEAWRVYYDGWRTAEMLTGPFRGTYHDGTGKDSNAEFADHSPESGFVWDPWLLSVGEAWN